MSLSSPSGCKTLGRMCPQSSWNLKAWAGVGQRDSIDYPMRKSLFGDGFAQDKNNWSTFLKAQQAGIHCQYFSGWYCFHTHTSGKTAIFTRHRKFMGSVALEVQSERSHPTLEISHVQPAHPNYQQRSLQPQTVCDLFRYDEAHQSVPKCVRILSSLRGALAVSTHFTNVSQAKWSTRYLCTMSWKANLKKFLCGG